VERDFELTALKYFAGIRTNWIADAMSGC